MNLKRFQILKAKVQKYNTRISFKVMDPREKHVFVKKGISVTAFSILNSLSCCLPVHHFQINSALNQKVFQKLFSTDSESVHDTFCSSIL